MALFVDVSDDCAICLLPYDNTHIKISNLRACGHHFCQDCLINSYLSNNLNCALCRADWSNFLMSNYNNRRQRRTITPINYSELTAREVRDAMPRRTITLDNNNILISPRRIKRTLTIINSNTIFQLSMNVLFDSRTGRQIIHNRNHLYIIPGPLSPYNHWNYFSVSDDFVMLPGDELL